MAKLFLGCLFAAALPLGGCQTTFDLVGVTQPLSARASNQYDGSYQGAITLVSGPSDKCPPSQNEQVVMIGDGVLWYAYSPSTFVTLPVNYDGTVSGTSNDTIMAGKIEGNRLRLTLKSPTCLTQMSMLYIYNHS